MTEGLVDVSSLDAKTTAALERLILNLADTKRILGIRYSDWLLGAPSIEAGIAASSLAQDEWGHARLIYATLKDLGIDPLEVEHERPAEQYRSVAALDRPLEDWAAVTAAVVVVDGGVSVALNGVRRGGFRTLAGRTTKMLAEEEFHADLGGAWFRRLARGSEEARRCLREAAGAMWPPTLCTLAPEDEQHALLVEHGITDPAKELRGSIRDEVGPFLELVGIEPTLDVDAGPHWDPRRGRGAGQPDEETVERARGDRNRALFVE